MQLSFRLPVCCLVVTTAFVATTPTIGAIARVQPAPDEQAERQTESEQLDGKPDEPAVSREEARERLRESLALLGFDAAFFDDFKSDEPLSDEEQAKLAKLLQGLPRIPQATLNRAAGRHSGLEVGLQRSPERGQAYALRMDILRVTRAEVPQALREILGYESYYRCEAETASTQLIVVAREVPQSWKLDAPLKQQASATALFIKQLPQAEGAARDESTEDGPLLLFATSRIAWHPPTLLAYLGVDYGLFDSVQDRTPLREREIFYQMLAAAAAMSPEYREYQVQRLLKRQLEFQERLARNRDLPAPQRAAAERTLQRARAGASDVVPLFNDPESHRGEFVVLYGEALRAIEIRVEDPQIRARFHLDRYYEVDIVTPDSQNNPVVCCLAHLPPDMPLGESIHESVRVAGFFLKGYAFPTRRSEANAKEKRQLQVAPLVVGDTLSIIPAPKFGTPTQSLTLAAGVLVVLAVCSAFMWHIRRTDRVAQAQLKLRRETLPEAISLEPSQDAGVDKS